MTGEVAPQPCHISASGPPIYGRGKGALGNKECDLQVDFSALGNFAAAPHEDERKFAIQ
jgi:hypothetical protein